MARRLRRCISFGTGKKKTKGGYMQQEPLKKTNPALAAIIIIVLIGIVTSVVIVVNNSNQSATNTGTEATDSSTPIENVSQYKDGTYQATGSYSTPGGRESIDVTVTLKDGAVEAIDVVGDATTGEAREYQAEFISAYKERVVGKDIEGVSLSRVAGSSLTSNGFNDAIDEIKAEAVI